MKKSIYLFICILAIMPIKSMSQTKEVIIVDAKEYNNYIIKHFDKTAVLISDFIKKLSVPVKDKSILLKESAEIQKVIDQSIDSIQILKDSMGFEEEWEFKNYALEYLEFFKYCNTTEYPIIIDELSKPTIDVPKIQAIFDKLNKDESLARESFSLAQSDFAILNGFELE